MTTYSAQGSTVDRAFVVADPSMDRQELYVAASRTRQETHLYATPEIQVHREEVAPASPYLRKGIAHLAEAAERDRAQLAAHEVALRSRFTGLPTEELVARHRELEGAADREAVLQERRDALSDRIERGYESLDGHRERREAAEELPRRERREELAQIESLERHSRRQLERLEGELREMPDPGDAARREFAVADQVLAERRQLAITAAQIAPPAYIKQELGARPADRAKQKAWDRGVEAIEAYRQRYSVKDPHRALGRERSVGERQRQREALRRIREAQRVLGLGQHAARKRNLGRLLE